MPGKAAGSLRPAARCSPVEKLPPAAWTCGRTFNAAQVEARLPPSLIPSDCRAEGVRGWI